MAVRMPARLRRPLIAAAAVVAICAGVWFAAHIRGERLRRPIAGNTAMQPTGGGSMQPQPPADPRLLVSIEFDGSSEMVVIPKTTRHRNVTVLWVYPAIRTAEASPPPSLEHDSQSISEGAHS